MGTTTLDTPVSPAEARDLLDQIRRQGAENDRLRATIGQAAADVEVVNLLLDGPALLLKVQGDLRRALAGA